MWRSSVKFVRRTCNLVKPSRVSYNIFCGRIQHLGRSLCQRSTRWTRTCAHGSDGRKSPALPSLSLPTQRTWAPPSASTSPFRWGTWSSTPIYTAQARQLPTLPTPDGQNATAPPHMILTPPPTPHPMSPTVRTTAFLPRPAKPPSLTSAPASLRPHRQPSSAKWMYMLTILSCCHKEGPWSGSKSKDICLWPSTVCSDLTTPVTPCARIPIQ